MFLHFFSFPQKKAFQKEKLKTAREIIFSKMRRGKKLLIYDRRPEKNIR
jgi:hypothetical protein